MSNSKRSSDLWKKRFLRHVPILKWIRKYKKSDFVADTVAGITLGLMLIPQSIAYAVLAGVSPEYGLYSSFMGGFIYFVFGTVKEVSVGPTSLISLLTFEFTNHMPLEIVFLFTFLCGVIEFFCGLLHLGFLVNFIPLPITTSFQSATSLIIIASQLKYFFGLNNIKSGRFLNTIYNVAKKIPETNLGDVILSIFCCGFLLSLRQIKDLKIMKTKQLTKNEKILKKTLWLISISRNAFCVLICAIVTYAFTRVGEPPFGITGNIPSGLPVFKFPHFSTRIGNQTLSFTEIFYEISPGLTVVPLISILANITIAKAFTGGSPVDATQEMLTLGLCNMMGACVGAVPSCGAFTRSAVSNSSGVRTPLAGLFTGTVLILVIKFLTPYFYYIPKASLGSVLICAVIFMIDIKTMFLLWKSNKRDFVCAIITFFMSLLVGVQIGLAIGIGLSLAYLLYLWANPNVQVQLKTTDEGNYYLVTPDVGLFYPASDVIQKKIANKCFDNVPVVIDCLYLKGIDYTSAQGIKDLIKYFKINGKKLAFVNVNKNIFTTLKNLNVEMNVKRCVTNDDEKRELIEGIFQFKNTTTTTNPLILLKTFNDCNNFDNLNKLPEEKVLLSNSK